MSREGFRSAAWSWADHLRAGGTTPWLEWIASLPSVRDRVSGGGPVPGAAQLELVRRLAGRDPAAAHAPGFPALADQALRRSGPGRGPARLPLLWPDQQPRRRVGSPAVDPARIAPDELVRVGIGLLAELLVTGADTPAPVSRPRPRRRAWHRQFHLAGAPITTALVRDAVEAAGHREGGRSPEVLLFAEPFDLLLAQVWSRRAQFGSPVRWRTFVGRWAQRDELPPAADLADIASYWGARVGSSRVHVVAGADPRRTATDVLRLRLAPTPLAPEPRSLAPEAVDLLRRLNKVLNVRADGERRKLLQRRAVALLPVDPAPRLAVPRRHREWLEARARRVTEDLRAGGYAVHGDLAGIAPRHAGPTYVRRPDVLELVLDTCLRAAELKA